MSSASSRCFRNGLGLPLLAICALAAPWFASADSTEVNVSAVIEHVYGPAHEVFATESASLAAAVANLCEAIREPRGNSDSNAAIDTLSDSKSPASALDDARKGFVRTVDAFSRIELLRVGPLLDDNRLNRLFYWPDSRRVTERQLRRLLASTSADTMYAEPQAMSDKSVAVQGLPALERILYTTVLTDPSASLEGCLVARDIASNVHAMGKALTDAWDSGTGIRAALLSPSAEGDLFRSQREVTRSLLTQISGGLEFIALRKLQPLSDKEARLRDAPFGRSVLTLNNLRGNLDSIQALLETSEMNRVSDVRDQLDFEFRIAADHLDSLTALKRLSDDDGYVTNEAERLFKALQVVVSSIAFTTDDRISLALGVNAGFNSSDGD